MKAAQVKRSAGDRGHPSRRDLLRAAAAAGALAVWPCTRLTVEAANGQAEAPTTRPGGPRPWWLEKYPQRARVVQVRSADALGAEQVNQSVVGDMLAAGVRVLTGQEVAAAAWRSLLGNAERIAVKFNRVGAEVLGTTEPLARELVAALENAGYARGRIALVEVAPDLARELGTWEPASGWGRSITVGGQSEELAAYLLEADAVINVPFLKTHRIAGMSGALKNLSHAVIRHPARYHANGCAPYVGEVIGNAEVSRRLRVTVVNALRIGVRNGPETGRGDVIGQCELLFGCDPVALDSVGLSILLKKRVELGLAGGVSVPYLEAAGEQGVGRREAHLIERISVGIGS